MNRGFARLWLASFCSETGEWMLQISLPILVYQQTGSTASTAAMMIVGLLPAVVLSPVAGVLADRLDRRVLLVIVCLGQALVAAPLLVMGSAAWLGYLVMAGQASLAALFEPARTAVVPELVGHDRIGAANGLLGSCTNIARLVGASLGGALFGFGGIVLVYPVYAGALVLAVVVLLPRFVLPPRDPVPRRAFLREWVDGLTVIRHDRRLWTVGGVLALMSLAQGMFLVLFVPFVLDVLDAGAPGTGLLRGVQAIGGLVAGVAVAALARRVSPRWMIGWGTLAIGVLSAVIWNGPHLTTAFGVYIGLFILVGVPGVLANAGLLSTLQTAAPAALTGRLMSTAFGAISLCTAAGMLLAGVGTRWIGLAGLLNLQCAMQILAGVLALLLLRQAAPRTSMVSASAMPVSPVAPVASRRS